MNQQANLETCGVSDHAVSQFQARIAQLTDMSARRVIRDGIQSAENILAFPDGNTLRVRTRRPFPSTFARIACSTTSAGTSWYYDCSWG
ncbi:MAG: hypothetical protein H0U18_09560 [Pyrinomonadaceae bacterium]|nr:hypothetical protein [Pyrinomonadaceae bacterium]